MKKIFTLLCTVLFASGLFAATEPAWYNDVTSITSNGQYYIYSVNGKAFMQAGQAQVKAITTSNYTNVSTFKFKISAANQGYVTNGSYYLKSYMVLTGSSNSGPVCTKQSDDGTKIIWTSMNGGEYWNIHSYYNAWFADRYPALRYQDNKYDGYMKHNGGIDYSSTKDTQTGTEFRWYLVSQAQLDRHFAIYFFDAYKETLNIAQYENHVPAAYYTALQTAYNKTFSVTNTAHSAEVVNAAKAELESLYNGASAIQTAYETAKATINALEAVEDKGEDFAQITADITAARTALEAAMTVEAVEASVAGLKAVDPITFNVTTFEVPGLVTNAATSAAGRAITYDAADKTIINAEGKAIYAGTTTLTATAEATADYYKFVRSAQVTVNAPDTYSNFERTICDESVEFNDVTYLESFAGDVPVGKNYMGGDSIVHVAITINHATFGTDTKTIAYGAEESWNGIDLSEYTVGTHQVPFVTTNAAGCDSTVTLNLTVNKMATLEVPVELEFCVGGSEAYRGVEYTEAGTFPVQAIGATRDTIYNVTVTILQPTFGTDSKTIVYGAQESWNGIDLSEYTVGTHQVPFVTTNAAGCDSTVTLNLTVNKMATLEVPETLEFCVGGSETYRGVEYSEAGTFNVPAEGATRDTVYVVTVNVLQPTTGTDTKTIVVGAEESWNGIALQDSTVGVHYVVYETTNVAGCDSTVTLTLTVTKANTVEVPVNLEFCAGDSAEYRHVTYTEAGVYPVLVEGLEADTLFTITVTVNELYYNEDEQSVTVGQAVFFEEDGWLLRGETPVTAMYLTNKADTTDLWFVYYGQTVHGCDSVERRIVTVDLLDPYEAEQELEFCEGDSVQYRDVWYAEAGEYPVYAEGEVRDTAINVIVTVHEIPVIVPGVVEVLAGDVVTLPEGEWYLGDSIVIGEYQTLRSDTMGLEFVQYAKTEFGCEYIDKIVVVVTPNYEAIENVFVGEKAEKFFREGQLYIRRGEDIYTVTGERVE